MIYSPHATAQHEDGQRYCTTCGADLDMASGKCSDALTIETYLADAMAKAMDRWAVDQQWQAMKEQR